MFMGVVKSNAGLLGHLVPESTVFLNNPGVAAAVCSAAEDPHIWLAFLTEGQQCPAGILARLGCRPAFHHSWRSLQLLGGTLQIPPALLAQRPCALAAVCTSHNTASIN